MKMTSNESEASDPPLPLSQPSPPIKVRPPSLPVLEASVKTSPANENELHSPAMETDIKAPRVIDDEDGDDRDSLAENIPCRFLSRDFPFHRPFSSGLAQDVRCVLCDCYLAVF